MSIQSMIDAAMPGDTVSVPPGIYNEQLVIDKQLTLQGPDPAQGIAMVDAASFPSGSTLTITSSQVTVRLISFKDGPGPGIRGGTPQFPDLEDILIEDCTITGHQQAGVVTIDSCAMEIAGNLIENNGLIVAGFVKAGIFLYPHGPTNITNNIIRNNGGDGIFARNSKSGLLIENNVIAGNVNSGITLAWDEQNVSIIGNTIEDCGLETDDLNGGIAIVQSMAETISGNTIENCRQRGLVWVWVPTTGPEPEQVLIVSNQIRHNSHDGIYLFSQGPGSFMPSDIYALKPLMTGNLIENNTGAGVFVSNGRPYTPGNANPHLECNSIQENAYGVFNQRAAIIDAVNNWWGDSSGPYHPTENPEGTGNPVSDNIDFIPWCTSAPLPPTTEIDCINVSKMYWACKKTLNNELVVDLSKRADGEVTETKCQKVELLSDPQHRLRAEKIPGTSQVRVSFYFACSILFKDSAGWKIVNKPPVFHKETFVVPPLVRDQRIAADANVYLECLECFVSGAKQVTCCLGKLIVLNLISSVQLMIPTYGFGPEPIDCQEIKNKCPDSAARISGGNAG